MGEQPEVTDGREHRESEKKAKEGEEKEASEVGSKQVEVLEGSKKLRGRGAVKVEVEGSMKRRSPEGVGKGRARKGDQERDACRLKEWESKNRSGRGVGREVEENRGAEKREQWRIGSQGVGKEV